MRYPIGTFQNPGYGLFPLLIGILLSLLSFVLLLGSILRNHSGKETLSPSGGQKRRYKVIATVLIMILYALTLDRLGFLFVTFVLLFLLFKAIGQQSIRFSLGVAIGVSFISYLLFKVFLSVPLPEGPWGL